MANYTTTGSDTFPDGHVLQTKHVQISLTDNASNYCTTSASAGVVINTASTDLQVTSFSLTAGNLLKVDYSAGCMHNSGSGNGIFGVKVDGAIYSVNFIIASNGGVLTCNFSKIFGSGLSSVTVAAWMASPNLTQKQLYHHDYTAFYTSEWSMTVQEIQM